MALLFHVDESRDAKHHFHVGLLVDGADAAKATISLNAVVERANDAGACRWGAELHGQVLFSRRGPWSKATVEQTIDVFEETLQVLGDCSVEVIARGVLLKNFKKRYGSTDPYRWEFMNLLERLNERLRVRREYAVVIADQQHEHRERLQRDVVDAHEFGTGGYRSQKLERVLDTAHFVDSKLSRMTQLADMAAFILRRRASMPTESDARAEAAMSKLHSLVWQCIPQPPGAYYRIRT